jgi:hypothetical protein
MHTDQHFLRGTPQHRREKRFRRLAVQADVLIALAAMSPREIYAGLLWVQQAKQHKRGWVAHAFRELFGGWPRPRGNIEPQRPSIALEQWVSHCHYQLAPKVDTLLRRHHPHEIDDLRDVLLRKDRGLAFFDRLSVERRRPPLHPLLRQLGHGRRICCLHLSVEAFLWDVSNAQRGLCLMIRKRSRPDRFLAW